MIALTVIAFGRKGQEKGPAPFGHRSVPTSILKGKGRKGKKKSGSVTSSSFSRTCQLLGGEAYYPATGRRKGEKKKETTARRTEKHSHEGEGGEKDPIVILSTTESLSQQQLIIIKIYRSERGRGKERGG